MPNPQDIFQLAQQTATQVTASPESWRRFLYTAAHNYHTTYLNQLLIHAQRPDATACADFDIWQWVHPDGVAVKASSSCNAIRVYPLPNECSP